MRPVFRTFRQPFSLRAAEGQRALLLHSELPSALIGERPAEASHQSSEEDGAASHLGAMHPGFEPPPFDEHPDVPREKPVSEQQLPTSRSQARRVAQSPPTGQGLAREVEVSRQSRILTPRGRALRNRTGHVHGGVPNPQCTFYSAREVRAFTS